MTKQPRLQGLGALRAVAALMVVTFHALSLSIAPVLGRNDGQNLLWGEYVAVDIFFTLSGCVLFLPMAKRGGDPGPYGGFLIRRVTRLWPAYAVILAAQYAAHDLVDAPLSRIPPAHGGWIVVVSHVLMLPTLTGFHAMGLGVSSVVWTISIEFSYSLVLPFIAGPWFRHPWRCLAAAAVTARLWDYVFTHFGSGSTLAANSTHSGHDFVHGAGFILELPNYAPQFGVGMVMARLIVVRRDQLARLGERALGVVFGIGLASALATLVLLGHREVRHPGGYEQWTFSWPILPSLSLLMIGLSLPGVRLRRLVESRPVQLVSELSYPIYLLHLYVMTAVAVRLHDSGWERFGVLMLTLVVTLAGAAAVHAVIEKPCMDWGRRRAMAYEADRSSRRLLA